MDYTYNLAEVKSALQTVIKNHFRCSLDLTKSNSYYKLSSDIDDQEELLQRCEGNNDYTIMWEGESDESLDLALQTYNGGDRRVDNEHLDEHLDLSLQIYDWTDRKDVIIDGTDDSQGHKSDDQQCSAACDRVQIESGLEDDSSFYQRNCHLPNHFQYESGSGAFEKVNKFSGTTYSSIKDSIGETRQSPFKRTYSKLFSKDKYVVNIPVVSKSCVELDTEWTYTSNSREDAATEATADSDSIIEGETPASIHHYEDISTTSDADADVTRRLSFSGSSFSLSKSITEVRKTPLKRVYSKLLSRDKYVVNTSDSQHIKQIEEESTEPLHDNRVKDGHQTPKHTKIHGSHNMDNSTSRGSDNQIKSEKPVFSGSTYSISNSITELQRNVFKRTYSKILARDIYDVNEKDVKDSKSMRDVEDSLNKSEDCELSVKTKSFCRIYSKVFARKKYHVNKRAVTKCFLHN